MDIMFLLIPMSVIIVFVIGIIFWWSLRQGQFEDLEGPSGFSWMMTALPAAGRPSGQMPEWAKRIHRKPIRLPRLIQINNIGTALTHTSALGFSGWRSSYARERVSLSVGVGGALRRTLFFCTSAFVQARFISQSKFLQCRIFDLSQNVGPTCLYAAQQT